MIFKTRQMSIGAKLSLGLFALIGGLFLIFIVVIGYVGTQAAESAAVREVSDKTKTLTSTIEIIDKDLRTEVGVFAKVFKAGFSENFSANTGRTIEVGPQTTPLLMNGGSVVKLNFAIPDKFTALTGVFATVFVRKGDDFIRITTSHKKENGERAIGTVMDHAHPAYQLMLDGKSYTGPATLFGGQYMTEYDPIKNEEGKVIGIMYVGVNFTDSMKSLADAIKSMKLGETGIFYALSAKEGKDLGKLLIHPTAEGENILALKDANGRDFVREMIDKKEGNFRYLEIGKNGGSPRERIVAFSYVKAWNMVVAGDVYLDEITAAEKRQRNMLFLAGLVAVALISGLIYLIIRSMVARPLLRALKIAESVASGNLSSRIQVDSRDETGQLLEALKEMNTSLIKIVGEVRSGTQTVASTSSQMAAGILDLSNRTEQQSGALTETASLMSELTSTSKQNADNARQANQLALSASEVAVQGGSVVSQVVSTMDSINESSKKIVDIIGVIDGIAFQTNILALNAAVEAARAGEQGRGFAVVATEVRNLAQRSAAAAKEIKALIGDSVEKVGTGAKLVDQAGATMQQIVSSIGRVTDIMGEIASASREQIAGIEKANQSIAQMDESTQQNAALVEESTAASQSLRQQAESLSHAVSVFKFGSDENTVRKSSPEATRQPTKANVAAIKSSREQRVRLAAPSSPKPSVADGKNRGDDWEEF